MAVNIGYSRTWYAHHVHYVNYFNMWCIENVLVHGSDTLLLIYFEVRNN